MWNSSFCCEGFGLTGDIWIISDESESGTLNTFQCFRKLLSFQMAVKVKGCIFFCLQNVFFQKSRKKCEISCAELELPPLTVPSSCKRSPWPFLGSRTSSDCFTCADDHHGFPELVELDLCPSLQAGDKCIQWLSVPWNLLQVNNGSLQCSSRLDQVHGPRGSSGGVPRCLSI